MARLRRLEADLPSVQERFQVPFRFRGSGYFKSIEPRHNVAEIRALYDRVAEMRPKRVLEIGTAKGGSLYLWTQAADADAVIVSVDLPGSDFGGSYPLCRTPFYQTFARAGQSLQLLQVDSHHPETVQHVRALFGGGRIDFAFIDGDHTYDGVRADFLNYGPLVRAGGLIAFHDILPRADEKSIQVDRFWNEIKGGRDSEELIGPEGSGRKIGIGVIRVASDKV